MAPKPEKGTGGSTRRKGALRRKQAMRDDDIMNTNDSSIVSKRSVSAHYLKNEPDFYEPFVPKLVRRNPLINRGYWLRMHAIEQCVLRFLKEKTPKSKVIVNLGCGYDPLPFQFWHRHSDICQNSVFVDVDYPQLMEKKRDQMLSNKLLREALLKTNLRYAESPIQLRSDRYMALGCDLKDLSNLERILKKVFNPASTSFLFVAEVSITYMPVGDSDALIQWAATQFADARFCLLEQYLPQGPGHPFARTMLAHFNKLQTTIHAVKKYPSLAQQQTRFLDAGWRTLDIARNLWDLWSDDGFTTPECRIRLDAVEPFDEWEEFAIFGCHYFLIFASNAGAGSQRLPTEAASIDSHGSGISQDPSIPTASVELVVQTHAADDAVAHRRFGAACSLSRDHIIFHGGQGPQQRLSSLDIFGRDHPSANCTSSQMPPARICHTLTSINDREALLVGGRKSPSMPLSDCWLYTGGEWTEVGGLQPARFRHSSIRARLRYEHAEDVDAVLVLGGKTADGRVLDDHQLWMPTQGWQTVPVVGCRPGPRFGAAVSAMDATDTRGLIVGGIGPTGIVYEDIWEFHLSTVPHLQLHFTDRTNEIVADFPRTRDKSLHARFGASLLPFENNLLLIGGVASKELLAPCDEFLAISPKAEAIEVHNPNVSFPLDAWPLLVGCGTAAVSDGRIIVAGGGAVCFSMGSFWNQGYFTIAPKEANDILPWSVSTVQPANPPAAELPKKLPKVKARNKHKGKAKGKPTSAATTKPPVTVPRIRLQLPEDFSELVKSSQPAIVEGLDLGPCVSLWTLEYLQEKVGPDRQVVIHDSTSSHLNFSTKNFTYTKVPFSTFISGVSNGAKTYLRSLSSTQPNKLPTTLTNDFPNIAPDFHIPPQLSLVKSTLHSSPLRISGPVSLWLHYDVLANVLCQIRGSKTLTLYPPHDAKHLSIPPGASSSTIPVPSLAHHPALENTTPHTARLKPGDILFIPPMWCHTASPEEGHSVAVNVFFKSLQSGYAAGKDVYGNRDLAAYENGRRDVARIIKGFGDVPSDVRGFYLDRLAAELAAAVKEGEGEGDVGGRE